MSLKIRLKRAGSKKRPFYRVVVTDSRKARDSRSIEDIGYYNPLEDPVVVNVDREKVTSWQSQGAQLSDTVRTLLRHENSVHPTRRKVISFVEETPQQREERKKAEKAEKAEEAAASAAAAVATAVAEATPAEEPAAEEAPAEAPAAEAAIEEAPAAEEAPAPEEAPAEEPAAEGEEKKSE